ncbi:MAG: hypothetical protein ACE5ES_02985 [Candidatus Nanoarchaeia archaeon]
MRLVYPAHSKHNFYFTEHISKFVLDQGMVPLNPFMVFHYFMFDRVDRDVVRNANNNIVRRCGELWVFGEISDGVLEEIRLVKRLGKPIRYFRILKSKDIVEIDKSEVKFEDELGIYASEL